MSLTIPLRSDLEDFDLQINLDATIYTLRFRWNRRDACWYMDVGEEDNTPIKISVKVVIDFPLGARCRDPPWPLGLFIAVDTSTARLDPGLGDLGARVQLLYFTADELPIDPSVPA